MDRRPRDDDKPYVASVDELEPVEHPEDELDRAEEELVEDEEERPLGFELPEGDAVEQRQPASTDDRPDEDQSGSDEILATADDADIADQRRSVRSFDDYPEP